MENGSDKGALKHLIEENATLKVNLLEVKELLIQRDADKLQLQTSYDEALQTLADCEAKRETAERELKIAKDQMASMWKELETLHRRLNGSNPNSTEGNGVNTVVINEGSLELYCTLCREKMRSETTPPLSSTINITSKTSKLWPFSRKPRLNQLDEHSKVCSSQMSAPSSSSSSSTNSKIKSKSKLNTSQMNTEERLNLVVNVTRTPTSETDLAPFKVVTRTTMPQFQREFYEVHRSAGDFQWLHDVLVNVCPERIVPPLRSTISLDATVSEYQRFLSRLSCHRFLRTEQPFIAFVTGTVEELRGLRAKFRPRLPSEEALQYRPAQGRDTSTGALVATKNYLDDLEQSLNGLVQRLLHPINDEDSLSIWFRAIAKGEPCDTYVKTASTDLARTCEAIESHHLNSDGDDALCVQNLQSIADYIRGAKDLLMRVEQAVDKFLFWDEEVTICEAVTSSPAIGDSLTTPQIDEVFDDSGVSSVSGSSVNSRGETEGSPIIEGRHEDSISEKWAQASSNCADAKEYLEMMCRDLSDELALFDLRKELELKQVFLDLAASQLEKNEKLQGKWYAMRCILDSPVNSGLRAIQFVNTQEQIEEIDTGSTKKRN